MLQNNLAILQKNEPKLLSYVTNKQSHVTKIKSHATQKTEPCYRTNEQYLKKMSHVTVPKNLCHVSQKTEPCYTKLCHVTKKYGAML